MPPRRKTPLLLVAVASFTACHRQAPPATQPVPPATPPAAQPVTGPGPVVTPPPVTSSSSDSADARRRTAAAVLSERIHFDYNIADVRPEDRPILDAKAALLRMYTTVSIRITGNCDERGSDQYNLALGMRRAAAAKDYLVLAGIDARRIEIATLGREVPLDTSGTEEAWARNRRDEFIVITGAMQ